MSPSTVTPSERGDTSSDPLAGDVDLQFPWRRPPEMTLDDVGGLTTVKEELRKTVVRPLGPKKEEYERFGIQVPNLLFEGPPGTGKTYTAQALAGELGFPYIIVTSARLQSKWVNESGDQVKRLFREAAHLAGEYGQAVIFMDEIDAIIPERGGQEQHHEDTKVVAELLSYLERSSENETLVIGSTNRRDQLDSAAVRPGRFDREFHFGVPDRETRYAVLKQHLDDRPTSLSQEAIQRAAVETEGWSSAAVTSLVDDAARQAVARDATAIEREDIIAALEQRSRHARQ